MSSGDILIAIFWLSLASTLVAVWGIWRQWKTMVLVSAVLAAPYALVLSGLPLTQFFLVEPAFHLVAAFSLQRAWRWVSWVMLALILAFAGWFWILRIVL